MLVFSPLEQFQILSLVTIKIFGFDFSITNAVLVNIVFLLCFSGTIYFFSAKNNSLNESSFFFIPNPWQIVFESIYEIVSQLVFDLVSTDNEKYLPFITIIFSFILFNNLIGLIPYSFTITSHLIITFTLSFSIFIGLNIICYQKHGLRIFSLFLPANTTFFLALLLVPIEFVSYIAKPISLGVRLFINLMAGHSLLKVIVGFAWSIMLLDGFASFSFLIPFLVLTLLMGLEFGVALIQTYVFITLTCIYLNEAEVLHYDAEVLPTLGKKNNSSKENFLLNLNKYCNFKTLEELFKKSYKRLKPYQKIGLFIYLMINVIRTYNNIIFSVFFLVPILYLVIRELPRVKGFLRIWARDQRVRTYHYRKDFYPVWVFVNLSMLIIMLNLLIIINFKALKLFFLSKGIVLPFTAFDYKFCTLCYFWFVILLNAIVQLYIIWFKNVSTILKVFNSHHVSIGAAITTYMGVVGLVSTTDVEDAPKLHYMYHEFDPLGRGYHFRLATEKRQVEMVQAVMKFRPEEILDKDKNISMSHFYAYVWHHRLEIGSKLNAAQKAEFPSWIFDVTTFKHTSLQQKLLIKNNFGVVIGQIAVDEKQIPGKLVMTYNDTPKMKVEHVVTDNNQISTRYLKNPESKYPKVEGSTGPAGSK